MFFFVFNETKKGQKILKIEKKQSFFYLCVFLFLLCVSKKVEKGKIYINKKNVSSNK